LLFCFALAVELLLMFSILPNLGLISRQRVQLLPFLFAVLVAAEATVRRAQGAPARRVPAARQARPAPVDLPVSC
jgi:type II secretory pathway component PulF